MTLAVLYVTTTTFIAKLSDTGAKLSMVFKLVVPQLNIAFIDLQSDFRSFSNKSKYDHQN